MISGDAPGSFLQAVASRLMAASPAPYKPVSQKPAAVLVPLFEDAHGDVRVVLTLRATRMSSHSGEVCLPGGKQEPGDADLTATALREAEEEIALPRSAVHVVASQQPPFLSKHMLSVTPVIGIIEAAARESFRCNEGEVEAIFDVPLKLFLTGSKHHKHRDVWWNETIPYRLHYFETQQGGMRYNIWGLTACILITIAQQVFEDRAPEFEEFVPDGPKYTDIYFDGTDVRIRRAS